MAVANYNSADDSKRLHQRGLFLITILATVLMSLGLLVHLRGTLPIDLAISQAIQANRTPMLDLLARAATASGSVGGVLAVVVLTALFFASQHKFRLAGIALISLVAYPLNVLFKDVVERVRPHNVLVQVLSPAGGYSFPSGHAMISSAVYGTAAYLLWVYFPRPSVRATIVGINLLWLLAIGTSRIYLGDHWFTDVIGGWVSGGLIVMAIIRLQISCRSKIDPKF